LPRIQKEFRTKKRVEGEKSMEESPLKAEREVKGIDKGDVSHGGGS
jgi:hypothetical protein